MVLDTVIMIVNYDRHMFIVQATGVKMQIQLSPLKSVVGAWLVTPDE